MREKEGCVPEKGGQDSGGRGMAGEGVYVKVGQQGEGKEVEGEGVRGTCMYSQKCYGRGLKKVMVFKGNLFLLLAMEL